MCYLFPSKNTCFHFHYIRKKSGQCTIEHTYILKIPLNQEILTKTLYHENNNFRSSHSTSDGYHVNQLPNDK
jgi:hypothetical protein